MFTACHFNHHIVATNYSTKGLVSKNFLRTLIVITCHWSLGMTVILDNTPDKIMKEIIAVNTSLIWSLIVDMVIIYSHGLELVVKHTSTSVRLNSLFNQVSNKYSIFIKIPYKKTILNQQSSLLQNSVRLYGPSDMLFSSQDIKLHTHWPN